MTTRISDLDDASVALYDKVNTMVEEVDSSVVHRTGDEEISGIKSFNSQASFAKGNGIKINGTDYYYTLRSYGSNSNGCSLLLNNNASTPAFLATDTFIALGSNSIISTCNSTIPVGDNSNKIATTGWARGATGTFYGNREWTGINTTTSNMVRVDYKCTGYTKGTAPSSDKHICCNRYIDSQNNVVADEYYFVPNGTNKSAYTLRLRNISSAEATGYKDVVFTYFDGSTSYYHIQADIPTCKTPSSTGENSTVIPTTAWCRTATGTFSGIRTWSGKQIFTTNPYLKSSYDLQYFGQTTDLAKGDAPSAFIYGGFSLKDKNLTELGYIRCSVNTNKLMTAELCARDVSSSSASSSYAIKIQVNANGDCYTSCPASDRTDSILTTKGISKTENGYVKLGNGLIIQWGVVKGVAYGSTTNNLTFQYPFSDANYTIQATSMSEQTGSNCSSAWAMKISSTSARIKTGKNNGTEEANVSWIAIGY